MNGVTVLVTGCGGPAGSALLRQLRDRRVAAIGADCDPPRDGVRLPPARAESFLRDLRITALVHGAGLVIPTVSEELVPLSRAGFDGQPDVLVGHPQAVGIADDKWLTARVLARNGIAVPRTLLGSAAGEPDDVLAALGSPVVAKPRVSRGARGVMVLDDPRDPRWAGLDGRWVLQQFAPGDEYGPVAYTSRNGRCLVVVLAKTGLTAGLVGNATGVRRLADHDGDDVARLVADTVRALGLRGPADVDVRRLPDGRPVVLEVNARFGANSEAAPELLDLVLAEHAGRSAA